MPDMDFVPQQFPGQSPMTTGDLSMLQQQMAPLTSKKVIPDTTLDSLVQFTSQGAPGTTTATPYNQPAETPKLQPTNPNFDPAKAHQEQVVWSNNLHNFPGAETKTGADFAAILNMNNLTTQMEEAFNSSSSTSSEQAATEEGGTGTTTVVKDSSGNPVLSPTGQPIKTTSRAVNLPNDQGSHQGSSSDSGSQGTTQTPTGSTTTTSTTVGTTTPSVSNASIAPTEENLTAAPAGGTTTTSSTPADTPPTVPGGISVTSPEGVQLLQNISTNTDQMLADAQFGLQSLINSIPNNDKNQPTQAFLTEVMKALNDLRAYLRTLQAGNSEEIRQKANEKLQDTLAKLKKQVEEQEAAEKAHKKMKTFGILMKIFTPILMIVAAAATVLSGGLAGPLLALTVALFVISMADQIVSAATGGKGMFAMAFEEMSKHLPAGLAMALKAVLLVVVIASAVACPANSIVALGLAFQMVAASGIVDDAVKVAQDHGLSGAGLDALRYSLTAVIALATIIATAGKGLQNFTKAAADDATGFAQGASGIAKTADETGKQGATSVTEKLKLYLTGSGDEVFGTKADPLRFSKSVNTAGQALNLAGTAGDVVVNTASGVQNMELAGLERIKGKKQQEIEEIEGLIRVIQKLIDSFLDQNVSLSDWTSSITDSMTGTVNAFSAGQTRLAQAGTV